MRAKLNTPPILILVYNRPELTRAVLKRVVKANPRQVYVSADGPTSSERDVEASEATRAVVREVVPKELLQTSFNDEHRGCKAGVIAGIDWFFGNETQGVILEDDTLPSQSFFEFAKELLDRFASDQRVMKISGFNLIPGKTMYPADYFFSHVSFSWGWATWRRAWELNDPSLSKLPLMRYFEMGEYPLLDATTRRAVRKASRGLDTWDYQWDHSIASQNGLHVVPAVNLIRNIGFGSDATHTIEDHSKRSEIAETELIFPLDHGPEIMMPNIGYQRALRARMRKDQAKSILPRTRRFLGQAAAWGRTNR